MKFRFMGKWAFVVPSVGYVGLDDAATGVLSIIEAALSDPGKLPAKALFNAYGDQTDFALQASNGKYISAVGDGYSASIDQSGEVAHFAAEQVPGGTLLRLSENNHYWNRDGLKLKRIEKTGTPPETTAFEKSIVTIGLDEIRFKKSAVNADLSWAYLSRTALEEIDFSNANLADADLSKSPLQNAKFNGADLSRANFERASLSHASLNKAILSESNLSYAIMDNVDLSEARLNSAKLIKAALQNGNLSKADFSSCDLSLAVLTYANISGSNFRGATLDSVNLNPAKIDECAYFIGASMKKARLDGANLMNIDMGGADLTSASLRGTILHGVNLSGAILSGADMTNAQLGAIALIFIVLDNEIAELKNALNKKEINTIAKIFAAHKFELQGQVDVESSPDNPNAWTVNDGNKSYYLRSETVGGSPRISAYISAKPASLSKALMRDTILTEANLMGIKASGVHLYGVMSDKALLDYAILEGADFSNANLGNINLVSASLSNAVLDSAVLTNANLQGAVLKGASLVGANLQSADFTDADLEDAVLKDAAVSVKVGESDSKNSDGVWIFDTGSRDINEYISELNNATKVIALDPNLEEELDNTEMSDTLREAFEEKGITLSGKACIAKLEEIEYWQLTDDNRTFRMNKGIHNKKAPDGITPVAAIICVGPDGIDPFSINLACANYLVEGKADDNVRKAFEENNINLTENASIQSLKETGIWMIKDMPVSYDVWVGLITLNPDRTISLSLKARSSFVRLNSLFQDMLGRRLRYQAVISNPDDDIWILEDDIDNPFNETTGYTSFILHKTDKNVLDVYGHKMRIVRQKEEGKTEFYNIICARTVLTEERFKDHTVCPNGINKDHNKGTEFSLWLRAKNPPKPPNCVPTRKYYCPSPQA